MMRVALAAAGLTLAFTTLASAQVQQLAVPRELYSEQLRQTGNSVTFCYNTDGMLADFERALATEIANALLVEPRFYELEASVVYQPPLDHRLPLQTGQIFVVLAQHCDAIMGWSLSPSDPDFVMASRPYMVTDTVPVTINPEFTSFANVPPGTDVGTRGLSLADNALINYNAAQAEENRLRRVQYRNNRDLLEQVLGGAVEIGLVWAPALYFVTQGDPASYGLTIMEPPPFAIRPLETGIGTRSNDTYLNQILSDAIDALRADGTVERLLIEHSFAPAPAL